jgi:formyl-CoA transferase
MSQELGDARWDSLMAPESHGDSASQSKSAGAAGPLAGVRVIEVGSLLAGPFAGRLLGDLGADVIKVEAPGRPDPLRDWTQERYEGKGLFWPVASRNKRCITLNLRVEQGQLLMLDLVRESDVVIENFRPGTLEKWNLSYDRLSEVNPGLILTRVSGFGQTGPYAKRTGYAAVAEAMGGLRYINGQPGEPPPRAGVSLGDSLGGLFAAVGTLSALHWRDGVGRGTGQVVDVSLMESCFALLEGMVPEYDRLGKVREPVGTRLPHVAPSNIFKSRDGKWLVIAANQDTLFARLCETMGHPELARDPRYASHRARGAHQAELEAIIAEWVAERDATETNEVLNEAGVVCGPIYSIADIFSDPQFLAREMLVTCQDPEFGSYIAPGVIPKLSKTPGRIRWSAPWTEGSHNTEVYKGLLNLSEERLAKLKHEGVI